MRRTAFSPSRVPGAGEELLSIELLEEHARLVAALLTITPQRGSGHAHLRQLKGHMRALRGDYTALRDDARLEPRLPPLNGCSTISTLSRLRRVTSTTIFRPRSSGGFPLSLPTSSPGFRGFTHSLSS